MKTVKLLCLQVYEWNKTDFWLINILCALSGILIYFWDIHPIIQVLLIISLLVKVFTYMRGASVMPSLGADTHQFSWKYMQSMPLNKREIVVFFMLTNVMAYLPLWVWFVSFQHILFELFDYKMEGIRSFIKIHVFILITMLLITPVSLIHLIQFPRQQFSRKNEKAYFYEGFKKVLIVICAIIYIICTLYYFNVEYDINLLYPIIKLFAFLVPYIKILPTIKIELSTFAVFGEMFLLIFVSKKVIRIWQKESLSYVQINWNAKRDIPIMTSCLVLITLPFQFNFMGTKEYYRKDPLLKTVYIGEIVEIKKVMGLKENINLKNKYGATVLMAAAENGNLENFKFLESLGARREGKLKFEKNPEKDVYELAIEKNNYAIAKYLLETGYIPKKTALVDIASNCNTKLNDLLIEKGADLKALNKKGESVLHIAAKNNCFGAVVSFVEMGADLALLDKNGKSAYDYISGKDNELAYYLAKKKRNPAGD